MECNSVDKHRISLRNIVEAEAPTNLKTEND